MKPALALLARCKGLRGTALDPFGRTEERRQERALIQRYRQTIEDLLPRLASCDMEHVLALARLPEAIRGFGPVKAQSMAEAETRWQHLVARLGVVSLPG